MKHKLNISVSKENQDNGIVATKKRSIREKLLTKLLGEKKKVMVIVPGESVVSITITEISEGGKSNGKSQRAIPST